MPQPKKINSDSIEPKRTFKPDKLERKLIIAMTKPGSIEEMGALLGDLMTQREIKEFSKRLEVARLIRSGKYSYKEIAEKINTSTTTVTRVAKFLFEGYGGYQRVL